MDPQLKAELDAMSEGERASLGEVRLNPTLPRAVLSQKAPGWGAVCCGNHGCLTLLFPGRSPIRTRCSRCQARSSGGRRGGRYGGGHGGEDAGGAPPFQTPAEQYTAAQTAVDRDEVKIIGHLKARYGDDAVRAPHQPLSGWERVRAAWRMIWEGKREVAPPVEVKVPVHTNASRSLPPSFAVASCPRRRLRSTYPSVDAAAAGPGPSEVGVAAVSTAPTTGIHFPTHVPPSVCVCGGWLLCGASVGAMLVANLCVWLLRGVLVGVVLVTNLCVCVCVCVGAGARIAGVPEYDWRMPLKARTGEK